MVTMKFLEYWSTASKAEIRGSTNKPVTSKAYFFSTRKSGRLIKSEVSSI
jgi:hypothetical protein